MCPDLLPLLSVSHRHSGLLLYVLSYGHLSLPSFLPFFPSLLSLFLGAQLYSSYVGEAEAELRALFSRGRASIPAVLFLDELDALVGSRGEGGGGKGGASAGGGDTESRLLATLLTEMDGVGAAEGVVVIAATNRKDMIDDALLRPGR